MAVIRRWVSFVLVASACSSHGARVESAAQHASAPLLEVVPAPATIRDPRTARLVDGLARVQRDLEAGALAPNAAFDEIEALAQVVGPPAIVIPPHEATCTSDDECALTHRLLGDDAGGHRCCPGSNRISAGTRQWIEDLDATCAGYDALRGTRAIELPVCGGFTGPLSANAARCRDGRCVACLESTDGSSAYCH